VAFNKNAASDNSPHRFGFQRSRLSAAFHPIPWSVGKTMDMLIMKDQSLPLRKEMAKLLAPPRLFLLVIISH
jgi:hypothetical protein